MFLDRTAIWLIVLLGAACSLVNLQPAKSADEQAPAGVQQMLELPLRVVDSDGKPVANAKVTPWALGSSLGHGLWFENDKWAGFGPKETITGEDGIATVLYPRYRDIHEQVLTQEVSLYVDHPKFAYVDRLHIHVPLKSNKPCEVKLLPGVQVEVHPLIDGKATSLDDVYLIWSDGRSWRKGTAPEKTADGSLRIPAMRPGGNSVLVVKMDGERATHFSKIVDFALAVGEPKMIDVPLRPSLRIQGVVSDNVPRPVRRGRIKMRTLPASHDYTRVAWESWTAIQPDGTFTVDGWPAEERIQVIALCDGYMASGRALNDSFCRPQEFDPGKDGRITLAMTALVPCVTTLVNEDNKPIAGVTVGSWPNVQWLNGGSQIYCHPLVRCERLLRDREYSKATDEAFPTPFQAKSDAHGKVTFELPAGREHLGIESDFYELPMASGRRSVDVKLVPGKTTEVTLRLQPSGTTKLGEWDEFMKAGKLRKEAADQAAKAKADK